MYDFLNPIIIWKYSVRFNDNSLTNRAPKDWYFEGSNDLSGWTILDERISQTGWDELVYREYEINNYTAYRYYRLFITDNNGANFITISEIEMFPVTFMSGATNYINYVNNHFYNVINTDNSVDTMVNISNFNSLSTNLNEYIEIEFRQNDYLYT
jgi:hypothetical protein